MKKILSVAAALLCGGIATASAGDARWTGFHVGLNGGYGWTGGDVTTRGGDPLTQGFAFGQPMVPSMTIAPDGHGGFGGLQAGYDWQFGGRGVAGVEVDVAAARLKSTASAPLNLFTTQPATFNVSRSIDWFSTVRGRIGLLMSPDLLIYATGGFAFGGVKETADLSLPPGVNNSAGNFGYGFGCGPFFGSAACFAGGASRTATGWTAGLGGEQRFTPNLSLKLEYLHVDLGSANYIMVTGSSGPFRPSFLNASSNTTIDLVRGGLNYRF